MVEPKWKSTARTQQNEKEVACRQRIGEMLNYWRKSTETIRGYMQKTTEYCIVNNNIVWNCVCKPYLRQEFAIFRRKEDGFYVSVTNKAINNEKTCGEFDCTWDGMNFISIEYNKTSGMYFADSEVEYLTVCKELRLFQFDKLLWTILLCTQKQK